LAKLRKAGLVTGDKEFKQAERDVKILWIAQPLTVTARFHFCFPWRSLTEKQRDPLKKAINRTDHGWSIEWFVLRFERLVTKLHCKRVQLNESPQGAHIQALIFESVQKDIEVVDKGIFEERSSRARSVSLIKDPAILEGMRYDVIAAVPPAFDLFQRIDQYILGDIESRQSLPQPGHFFAAAARRTERVILNYQKVYVRCQLEITARSRTEENHLSRLHGLHNLPRHLFK
jgi:hypothetical protein